MLFLYLYKNLVKLFNNPNAPSEIPIIEMMIMLMVKTNQIPASLMSYSYVSGSLTEWYFIISKRNSNSNLSIKPELS